MKAAGTMGMATPLPCNRFGECVGPSSVLDPQVAFIRNEADGFSAQAAEIAATQALWSTQTDRIRSAVPDIQIEDGGDTLRLGPLSPGCRACKDGTWDCIFTCMSCNLACPFCLTPRGVREATKLQSAFGCDIAGLCADYRRLGVSGVGFTGGEPFLEPRRLLDAVAVLRREMPTLHIWAYTNGTLLTSAMLAELADAGLDELRFNLAATGYRHSHVDQMLREAAAVIPAVAVEVPVLPEHEAALIASLEPWASAGVRYLNLHDLIYEPATPSDGMPGIRIRCTMPDGHRCAFNPRSAELVAKIMERVSFKRIPLSVNYCSLRNKARQIRGRRRLAAVHTLLPHETLCDDGQAESLCLFGDGPVEFAHSERLAEWLSGKGQRQAARIRRLLPFTHEATGRWTHFEMLTRCRTP